MGAEIRVAKEAGVCCGVERALKLVRRASEAGEGPVLTLGPLIHNPTVVAELEAAGVGVTDEPSQRPGVTIVLRTHGVTPEVERAARESGATVIDATCPFVKRVHRCVEQLSREGYQVVIIGERGHAEVEATLARVPDAVVVNSVRQAESVSAKRIGVVVQTTQSKAKLEQITSTLVTRADELRVMNTICDATSVRQRAAEELAQEADVMIVIGGRNSANTTRLAEICSRACAKTHHVEGADELRAEWFDSASLIGITAGASTPRKHIELVRHAIESMVAGT